MTSTISRGDIVLGVIETAWRTTSYLDGLLYDRGFTWGAGVTRNLLNALHDLGQIEKQRAGAGYRWRRPERLVSLNTPAGTSAAVAADDLRALAAHVNDLASVIAAQPAEPPCGPREVVIGDDVDLADLSEAQGVLVKRIVKRTAYDTGKAMLDVLDGWYEGACENHVALEHSDDDDGCLVFTVKDIRRMVDDAMRVMGAPAHRAAE